MLVLAIDTSTPVITVGVVNLKRPHEIAAELERAGHITDQVNQTGEFAFLPQSDVYAVLAEKVRTDAFGHVEHLMPMVTDTLAETGHVVGDLEAVVVGIGPGPFTGLRVGMVTAAALGDALNIPVHGAPSHDAVARQSCWAGDFLVVTDARRKEVYVTAYAESAVAVHGPVALAPAAVLGWCAENGFTPEWIAGAGAHLAAEATGLDVRKVTAPLSESLVACATGALLTGAIPGPLTPLYLRRPDATEPHAPKPALPKS
ncbi:MAG: tRNA (adenosine(37)-N6)-threonylcarbamoyltransferase complex dimerization subunit type 1 TsaB [Nakamurella sp.]